MELVQIYITNLNKIAFVNQFPCFFYVFINFLSWIRILNTPENEC